MGFEGRPELIRTVLGGHGVLVGEELLAGQLGLLFSEDKGVEMVTRVEFGDGGGKKLNILLVSDQLLFLLNVVIALAEGGLPVLLVKVGVIVCLVGD